MAGVIKEFLSGKFDTVMKISTEVIRFHSNGTVFIDPPTNVDQTGHMTEVGGGIEAAVYEAPEVLGRQDPGAKAFSWTVGCVVYEMLALEPAFYDRTGGMNPFSVFMDIMQGNLPPDPTHGSAELIALMGCCFKTDPNKRPSLEYLLDIAEQNIQTLTSMSWFRSILRFLLISHLFKIFNKHLFFSYFKQMIQKEFCSSSFIFESWYKPTSTGIYKPHTVLMGYIFTLKFIK